METNDLTTRFNAKIEKEPNLKFLEALFRELPKMELYLVGGMVRDTIIKHPTSKDFDFVARGIPIEKLIDALQKLGHVEFTGRNFGVLKFTPKDSTLKEAIDIALPRTEHAEGTGGSRDVATQSDHNLPVEEDLARRDLTINAIAWNLREQKLVDPFNGLKDLKDKKIRAVGDPTERIKEDYSRMLRALRFACRFGFDIEEKTMAAIKNKIGGLNQKGPVLILGIINRKIEMATDPADKAKLQEQLEAQLAKATYETKVDFITPRETIAKELIKTFQENPGRAMELYDQSGAFDVLMSEVLTMKACEQPLEFHAEGDVWTHTKMMLEKIGSKEFREYFKGVHLTGEFALGVLLHDAGKPLTKQTPAKDGIDRIRFNGHDEAGVKIALDIASRLHLPNDTKNMWKFIIGEHMVPMSGRDMFQMSDHKFARRFIDSPYSTELLMLFYLDSVCSVRADGADTLQNFRDTLKRIEEIKQRRANQPEKIIDGKKIMDVLQIKSGTLVGVVISVFSELADAGKVNSEAEALEILAKHKDLFTSVKDIVTKDNREEVAQEIIDKIVKLYAWQ